MERLSEQLMSCDRESLRRIAHSMPDTPAERPQAEQTAEIFNALFSALRAAFPAAMAGFREQSDFNELRRQWAMAFQENGITTMAQVAAGMRDTSLHTAGTKARCWMLLNSILNASPTSALAASAPASPSTRISPGQP